MNFKLSILDQSSARSRDCASEAFQETLAMAQVCEDLGYHRFWLSEHHAFPVVAGSAPEVLLAAVGSVTNSIRIGSGGIMLPHYSPYKVAEQFSVLGNLFPGRVDLGVGRAPGADMATAVALAPDGRTRFHEFPAQVEALSDFLYNPNAKPVVSPKPPAELPLYMLGSSIDSALLAAARGLPYTLGAFINPEAQPDLIAIYRERFQPSERCPEPYVMLAIGAFCAESEAQARSQQRTFDINFFRIITGQDQGKFLSPDEAMAVPDHPAFLGFAQRQSLARATGTPAQVKARIIDFAERFSADEVMLVSNIYHYSERAECLRLIMAEF